MVLGGAALAAKSYGPGASDSEIRIGNTVPYSGPLSLYCLIGRTESAYFKKLNDDAKSRMDDRCLAWACALS